MIFSGGSRKQAALTSRISMWKKLTEIKEVSFVMSLGLTAALLHQAHLRNEEKQSKKTKNKHVTYVDDLALKTNFVTETA